MSGELFFKFLSVENKLGNETVICANLDLKTTMCWRRSRCIWALQRHDSWVAMTANWWKKKNNESYLRSLRASDKQGPADFDSIFLNLFQHLGNSNAPISACHEFSRAPFGVLGVFFLTNWGFHFCSPEAQRVTILVLREHRGRFF